MVFNPCKDRHTTSFPAPALYMSVNKPRPGYVPL